MNKKGLKYYGYCGGNSVSEFSKTTQFVGINNFVAMIFRDCA
jgi:hypothetical protein